MLVFNISHKYRKATYNANPAGQDLYKSGSIPVSVYTGQGLYRSGSIPVRVYTGQGLYQSGYVPVTVYTDCLPNVYYSLVAPAQY